MILPILTLMSSSSSLSSSLCFFFFNDTAPPEISPLSLHDALPISPHYGVSTGFGALASRPIPPELRAQLQRSLVRSHAAGSGPEVEAEVVRAMMLLRLSTLRSEEHTSELQSPDHLVCPLLLEKKKH